MVLIARASSSGRRFHCGSTKIWRKFDFFSKKLIHFKSQLGQREDIQRVIQSDKRDELSTSEILLVSVSPADRRESFSANPRGIHHDLKKSLLKKIEPNQL